MKKINSNWRACMVGLYPINQPPLPPAPPPKIRGAATELQPPQAQQGEANQLLPILLKAAALTPLVFSYSCRTFQ